MPVTIATELLGRLEQRSPDPESESRGALERRGSPYTDWRRGMRKPLILLAALESKRHASS